MVWVFGSGAGNDANNVQHIGVAPTVVIGPKLPTKPPQPIPTLGEWGEIIMMLMMLLSVDYQGWRRQGD